jgi:hypothetical protein
MAAAFVLGLALVAALAEASYDLELLSSIGGDGSEIVFGQIVDLKCDGETLYVLDRQQRGIFVLGNDGQLLGQLGRSGEAPGEFNGHIVDLYLAPDSTIGVNQSHPNRIVRFSTTTQLPLDDLHLPGLVATGFTAIAGIEAVPNGWVIIANRFQTQSGLQEQHWRLSTFAQTGATETVLHETRAELDFARLRLRESELENFAQRWCVSGTGQLAWAPDFHAYRILLASASGASKVTIERDSFQNVQRAPEHLAYARALYGSLVEGREHAAYEVSSSYATIQGLWFRGDGSLWVLSSRGRFAARSADRLEFDVFAPSGSYSETIALRAPTTFEFEDRLFLCPNHLHRIRNAASAELAAAVENADGVWPPLRDAPLIVETLDLPQALRDAR